MPAALGVGAAGSIVSGIIGANAAGNAASEQVAQQQKALGVEQGNQNQALTYQNQQLAATQQQQQPYLQAGTGALGSLSNLLGVGAGNGQAGYGSLLQGYGNFNAPTLAQAEAQPGYQFALQQGMNSLQNSAAAQGTLLSGGTAAGIEQYGQQAAEQNYGNVYNQMLGTYQQNYQTFQQNQANQYNRLMGVTGVGQQSANTLAGAQQAAAGETGNILMTGAGQQGQTYGNIGNAQAAGTIGQANAITGAIGNISNLASTAGILNYLQGSQGGGGGQGYSGSYGSSYGS
jgi:hypothetical protein